MLVYRIHLTPDDNGTSLVTAPDFPEVTTFGSDRAECLEHGRNAIEEAIGARIARGEDIPNPIDPYQAKPEGEWVKLPIQTSLKAFLHAGLRSTGITRAELARRLAWNRESVDRLFRLDHRSRLEQLEAAFHALGKEIGIVMREAA